MRLVKRYRFFLATVAVTLGIFLVNRPLGTKATQVTLFSFKEMALVIPPVFVLLGLLDVWVPKQMMMRLMGEKSGLLGIVLAIILGSVAAGPLYGAFPVAAVFMRKGVKFVNILIFIGAWSTTKIPMLLFEMSALGARFALTRLAVDIPGIILIGYILQAVMPRKEVEELYRAVESL